MIAAQATVESAVQYLASVCDYAATEDGRGFNGTDTGIGHWLASQPPEKWTAEMRASAYDMIAKYRGQLDGAGIPFDEIPEPERPAGSKKAVRQAAQNQRMAANRVLQERDREKQERAQRVVWLDDGHFKISSPYHDALVAAIKDIPGRRWDGKLNIVPADPFAAAALQRVVQEYGFRVDESAAERLAALAAEGATAEPPATHYVHLDAAGEFIVGFPYDRELVGEMQKIDGRRWDGDAKVNRIAPELQAAADLVHFLDSHPEFQVSTEATAELRRLARESTHARARKAELREASKAEDADIEVEGLGGTLMPFQRAGVAYALRTRRTFIGDDMGTGKTMQALAAIQKADAYPAVIVCPATLKLNWRREARKWLPGKKIVVLEGRKADPQKLAGADLIILNYDILADWTGREGKKARKQKRPQVTREVDGRTVRGCVWKREPAGLPAHLAERVIREDKGWFVPSTPHELIPAKEADPPGPLVKAKKLAVVFDESQYVKSGRKADRAAAALRLAKSVPWEGLRLNLTGTAVMNRPIELVPQLEVLDRLQEFGGFMRFAKRYCAAYKDPNSGYWDFSGASNTEELHRRLRETCFIRRRKADVLKELPPKTWAQIPLTITNGAEYRSAEADVLAYLRAEVDADEAFLAEIADLPPEERERRLRERREARVDSAKDAEELVRLNKLRQIVGEGKAAGAVEWIKDFLTSSDEKLVVFAAHIAVQQVLVKAFPEAVTILGSANREKVERDKERFQTDPSARLMICSLKAANFGHTLHAASNVALLELDWTPTMMTQAEDRVHREGQRDAVTCWYLLADGTIDDDMNALLDEKRAVVDAIQDGRAEERKVNVRRDLVARMLAKAAA